MSTAVQVAPAVGILAVREARGMTQGQLITALLKRGSQKGVVMPTRESLRVAVSRWENSRLTPSREHLLLLADVLGCEISDLVELPTARPASPRLPVSPSSLEQIGADFETVLGQMIATDHLNGGAHALMAMAEAGYKSLHEVCVQNGPLPNLLGVAAHYAEFIGWLYQDQRQLGKARRWTRDAADLAMAAGDNDLSAYMLMRRSAIETDGHAAEDALVLALGAQHYAASPGTAALSARQIGLAHALSGDRRHSLEAMEQAVMSAEVASQSALTVYATVPYMLMEGGAAACQTEDYQHAVCLLEQALTDWPAEQQLRDRTLCTARLALAYAKSGQIDAAATTASIGHQGLATAPSSRASVVLDEVTRMVSRDGSLKEVQELEEVRRAKRS